MYFLKQNVLCVLYIQQHSKEFTFTELSRVTTLFKTRHLVLLTRIVLVPNSLKTIKNQQHSDEEYHMNIKYLILCYSKGKERDISNVRRLRASKRKLGLNERRACAAIYCSNTCQHLFTVQSQVEKMY